MHFSPLTSVSIRLLCLSLIAHLLRRTDAFREGLSLSTEPQYIISGADTFNSPANIRIVKRSAQSMSENGSTISSTSDGVPSISSTILSSTLNSPTTTTKIPNDPITASTTSKPTTTTTTPITHSKTTSTTPKSSTTTTTTTESTSTLSVETTEPSITMKATTEKFIIKKDFHSYYKTYTSGNDEFSKRWISFEDMKRMGHVRNEVLSDNHKVAVAYHKLGFEFPFYGHPLQTITIATGGFLYTSDFLHPWLTATQYIAPLMANFDTRIGEDKSEIYYARDDNKFVVMWENVYLKKQKTEHFTFQAILHKSGQIVFNYKAVPIRLSKIYKGLHPVKVGLSDAYYMDQGRLKVIYEYHNVKIDQELIVANRSIIIDPLKTCNILKSCSSCIAPGAAPYFKCMWCSKLNRCSSGEDRHRQKWIEKKCHLNTGINQCHGGKRTAGIVILTLFILILVSLPIVWLLFAYRNPHTPSGQWLISHRPSELKHKFNMKFFNKNNSSGDNYVVSMGSSTA